MVYCQNSQSKTKAVTLVFKREELLYDAENYSFVEGDIMRGFRGTPYKAFRIALICTLDKSESLLGFSVQFNPRMLNRLR